MSGGAMTIEEEILAVSAAQVAALLANDADGVAGFMTNDWVYVGPTGATPKADLIGWIASGRLAHHSMRTVGRARVAVHGDAAIVTARTASTGSWEGVDYVADEWISEIYVRRGGRWQIALSHKCPVED
jgi:ketosteroid isomerase-like protein